MYDENNDDALNELRRIEEEKSLENNNDYSIQEDDNDLNKAENIVKSNLAKNIKVENRYSEIGDLSPNLVDGWRPIPDDEIPNFARFYPESWKFAYRSPKTKEVSNFSTIQENDTPAIIAAIEDLIKKCVKIYDTDLNIEISSAEINDAHKLFFILKLREAYIPDSPITYNSVCDICHDPFDARLLSGSLKYNEQKEELYDAFDGRVFSLDMGIGENINFHIPTIGIMSRLFKYIVKVHRDPNPNDKEKKESKVVYDKEFLLLAPYMFETGKETISEIIRKYEIVKKDDRLHEAYLKISNNLKLDNAEYIEQMCPHCNAEVTVQVSFPGGWKSLFNKPIDDIKYF